MSIVLSCGHHVDDFDNAYSVITKYFDHTDQKALNYQTVCADCKKQYRRTDSLFLSDREALLWLHSVKW